MKNCIRYFLFVFGILVLPSFDLNTSGVIHDFKLKNTDGRMVSLSSYPSAKGFIIVFTCNHCPFAKLYPQRLNALNAYYSKLSIPLIAISSTDTVNYEEDRFDKMVKKSRAEKFNFPYLYDNTQDVARQFSAGKTPHAFVIWKENGQFVVRYSGAIDDNGADPDKVTHKYVEDAVNALMQGKEVRVKETKSVGCQIHFRK